MSSRIPIRLTLPIKSGFISLLDIIFKNIMNKTGHLHVISILLIDHIEPWPYWDSSRIFSLNISHFNLDFIILVLWLGRLADCQFYGQSASMITYSIATVGNWNTCVASICVFCMHVYWRMCAYLLMIERNNNRLHSATSLEIPCRIMNQVHYYLVFPTLTQDNIVTSLRASNSMVSWFEIRRLHIKIPLWT